MVRTEANRKMNCKDTLNNIKGIVDFICDDRRKPFFDNREAGRYSVAKEALEILKQHKFLIFKMDCEEQLTTLESLLRSIIKDLCEKKSDRFTLGQYEMASDLLDNIKHIDKNVTK